MDSSQHHTKAEKLLLEAARVFNSTLEYEELIRLVLRLVMKAVSAEAAMVFRIDHDRTDMKIRMMKSTEDDVRIVTRELGDGSVGWVARYKEPLIINDPSHDLRVDPGIARECGIVPQSIISLPLVGKGQMIGVVAAMNSAGSHFSEQDLDILTGLNNQIAVAIDNAHLYREVKKEALEKHIMYEIGKKLSSSLELDELLREILDSMKQVVSYDAGGIFLVDPKSGDLKSIHSVGYDPELENNLNLKTGQGLIGHVASTGESLIVPDVSGDSRYVGGSRSTRSEILVPIKIDDRLIGVLNLESSQLNAYNSSSLALMDAFASQAAISLERARSHQSMLDARKIEEQLNVAREIQQSFLPKTRPIIPEYDISGTNIPSGQVGGDYYDFLRIVEGHLGIAIADVSGKGIPAALIMASFRASLIAEIRNNYSIRTICSKVNSLLCESVEPGNFVTAVYGVLDFRNHILTFANCGHNLPVLLRNNGDVEYLSEGGPVLGVTTSGIFQERALVVNPGDICVWYTDGVTEVFDRKGEEFGLERLIELLRRNREKTSIEIQEAVLSAVKPFASPEYVFDDLTMVVFKRLTR